MLSQSREKWKNTQRDIEAEKREALLKIKDELYKKRIDFEQEMKRVVPILIGCIRRLMKNMML